MHPDHAEEDQARNRKQKSETEAEIIAWLSKYSGRVFGKPHHPAEAQKQQQLVNAVNFAAGMLTDLLNQKR